MYKSKDLTSLNTPTGRLKVKNKDNDEVSAMTAMTLNDSDIDGDFDGIRQDSRFKIRILMNDLPC